MNILYISQYFYPEIGATTNRALANVRHLSKRHQVTVLTEMPNHPKGVIFDGYKKKLFLTEKMESFVIKRLWVWTSPKKVFYTRILFYLTFAFFGSLYTVFNAGKYDVVYLTSPPLFVSLVGIFTKLIRPKSKIVFEVRDLWPDCAIEMGELSNKNLIRLSYWMESKIYKLSNKVISVTEFIKNEIVAKNVSPEKVVVVANGIEPEIAYLELNRKVPEIAIRKEKGDFIVIYAGILGLAQNITTIIKAAEILKDERISFFIAGTGPKEEELRQQAFNLRNLTFLGEIPRGDMHNYLLSADCGIIPLAALPVFKGHVPSKLYEYMAFSLPVLLGIEGESADILRDADAGITFTPDDHKDLAEKIVFLQNNPEKLKEYSQTGKDYVLKHFNRTRQAEHLETVLQGIADRKN